MSNVLWDFLERFVLEICTEGPEHYISCTYADNFIITRCSFLDSLISKSTLGLYDDPI